MKRIYIVHYKRGRLRIEVEDTTVKMRGEKEAVVQAAWFALMGQNNLGEDIDKKSPTRKILMDELRSRYEAHRHQVYEKFSETINFTLIGVEHG